MSDFLLLTVQFEYQVIKSWYHFVLDKIIFKICSQNISPELELKEKEYHASTITFLTAIVSYWAVECQIIKT
jgi:hypothetical protein